MSEAAKLINVAIDKPLLTFLNTSAVLSFLSNSKALIKAVLLKKYIVEKAITKLGATDRYKLLPLNSKKPIKKLNKWKLKLSRK